MIASRRLLIPLLLAEQYRGDLSPYLAPAGGLRPPLPVLIGGAPAMDVPDGELPLIAAAAALAAGEPKRALRILADTEDLGGLRDVAAALRFAAHTLDLNRYPGGSGAVMSAEEMASLAGELPAPADPGSQLIVLVAGRLIPLIQSARRIAEDSRTGDPGGAVLQVYDWFQMMAAQLADFDAPEVLTYLWLARADVARRAARMADTADPLDACRRLAGDDPVAHAHLNLIRGDWALEPLSHPEVLGLQLTSGLPPGMAAAADVPAAESFYAAANALYRQAGAARGQAVVTFRRAHLARHLRNHTACTQLRDDARWQALRCGERGLVRIIDVHSVLDRLDSGEDVPPGELDPIAEWGHADGSTGLARGLVRLIIARANAWRDTGATLAALRALRIARRFVRALDAEVESESADRAYIDLADRVNFRRASAALLAAETAEAVTRMRDQPADVLAWLRGADLVMSLDRAVEALADPDFKAVAAARLAEIDAAAPVVRPEQPSPVDPAVAAVRESARRAEMLLLRYRGRRAEQAGFREQARGLLQDALARAERDGDALMQIVLLVELDRRDEARPIADRLFGSGALHPDHAADLYLRLGDAASAQRALDMLDAAGWTPPVDRPWEDPARRAELAELAGDHVTAARLAGKAAEEFERRAAQLVRDALRSSATDDVTVAGLYHTGALAHLGLAAQQPDSAGSTETAAAFDMAERCRGVVVDVLRSLDSLPAGPPQAAVRRWLEAGSAWAAMYEGLADEVTQDPAHTPSAAHLRRRLLAAEDELDQTEMQVARLAPGVLAGRRGYRPGSDLADVQRHLGDDTALVLYETFDEDLLVWALDRRAVRHERIRIKARDLACEARRFHTSCATQRPDDPAGTALAKLLLDPVASVIDGHRRLLVVPHRSLALVPFHALPFDGTVLGEHAAVSVLPSGALVTRREAGRPPRLDRPALLVGDPAYAADRGLPRLPGAATEAATIARLIGTPDPLLDADATEAAVAERVSGRRIVHLATHGVVDERGPNRSFVALAGYDELTVGDIMGLDLAADLVVLSACHTGRGTATAGGDIVGLVRAAVAAGARHIVVSLWPVDDEAGCLLMTGMYERLVAGDDVAHALTGAQRRVRRMDGAGRRDAYEQLRQQADTQPAIPGARDARPPNFVPQTKKSGFPYYWAPFIHVGV